MNCEIPQIYRNPKVATGWMVSKNGSAWKITQDQQGFTASSYFYAEFLQYIKNLNVHAAAVKLKDLPAEVQKIIESL